ncbi:MAG TPA: hypothetical protein PLH91_08190 [Tenuifilaceae bacterium]|nr:hypothetical protein [Tenuifilaceae bacterium]HPI45197.1 hypothetical protein [Tenuifilaceae bacterium]HPN20865.1 hypothetical protein [Tenuifilaceae bacterium]HPV57153.1 hypothetical protein [Tenuifilaceae bacterium]
METVDVITKATYIFFIYLLMAVFVERAVEIFVSIFNYCDLKWKRYRVWNNRAEKYRDKLDRLYNFDSSTKVNKMFNWLLWGVVTEPAYTGGKMIISAQTIRTKSLQIYCRVCSNLISLVLVLVLYYGFDITMIDAISRVTIGSDSISTATVAFFQRNVLLGVVISAVLVAVGVEPLHNIIGKIEKAGKKKS